MKKAETIRTIQSIKFSGTNCPTPPNHVAAIGREKKNIDPASTSRTENYPIPASFGYRTIGLELFR